MRTAFPGTFAMFVEYAVIAITEYLFLRIHNA